MHVTRTTATPLLALATLAALGLAAMPAVAQSRTYSLQDVLFTDGAVATGYFTYDTSNGTVGAFDITTTNGATDSYAGYHYTNAVSRSQVASSQYFAFITDGTQTTPFTAVSLDFQTALAGSGSYPLAPGYDAGGGAFYNSGEQNQRGGTYSHRLIASGSATATPNIAGAPEPSEWAALGFTGLGIAGLLLRARKRNAA